MMLRLCNHIPQTTSTVSLSDFFLSHCLDGQQGMKFLLSPCLLAMYSGPPHGIAFSGALPLYSILLVW